MRDKFKMRLAAIVAVIFLGGYYALCTVKQVYSAENHMIMLRII